MITINKPCSANEIIAVSGHCVAAARIDSFARRHFSFIGNKCHRLEHLQCRSVHDYQLAAYASIKSRAAKVYLYFSQMTLLSLEPVYDYHFESNSASMYKTASTNDAGQLFAASLICVRRREQRYPRRRRADRPTNEGDEKNMLPLRKPCREEEKKRSE